MQNVCPVRSNTSCPVRIKLAGSVATVTPPPSSPQMAKRTRREWRWINLYKSYFLLLACTGHIIFTMRMWRVFFVIIFWTIPFPLKTHRHSTSFFCKYIFLICYPLYALNVWSSLNITHMLYFHFNFSTEIKTVNSINSKY